MKGFIEEIVMDKMNKLCWYQLFVRYRYIHRAFCYNAGIIEGPAYNNKSKKTRVSLNSGFQIPSIHVSSVYSMPLSWIGWIILNSSYLVLTLIHLSPYLHPPSHAASYAFASYPSVQNLHLLHRRLRFLSTCILQPCSDISWSFGVQSLCAGSDL
jgi:hypothetical protein